MTTKNKPLNIWLATQPPEFVKEYFSKPMLGDGQFTIDKLRELDNIHNPEDE